MESLQRAFREASKNLESNGVTPFTTRSNLERVLLTTPSVCATTLYAELCRVQLARDNMISLQTAAPFVILDGVDFGDEESVRRFHSAFIDDGWLIDRVADVIDLSVDKRRRKWATQHSNAALEARLHHRVSLDHKQWSMFLLQSRQSNRISYENVRSMLQSKSPPRLHEWQTLILETPECLKRKNLTFWRALQLTNCTTEEKQAVCHKLEQCREIAPSGVVPKLSRALSEDIYSDSQRNAQLKKKRRGPLLQMLLRRMFRRRAVVELYDSSTSALGFQSYA